MLKYRIFEKDRQVPNCLQQMANILGKLDDHSLILEYASWITKHDEVIGVNV